MNIPAGDDEQAIDEIPEEDIFAEDGEEDVVLSDKDENFDDDGFSRIVTAKKGYNFGGLFNIFNRKKAKTPRVRMFGGNDSASMLGVLDTEREDADSSLRNILSHRGLTPRAMQES